MLSVNQVLAYRLALRLPQRSIQRILFRCISQPTLLTLDTIRLPILLQLVPQILAWAAHFPVNMTLQPESSQWQTRLILRLMLEHHSLLQYRIPIKIIIQKFQFQDSSYRPFQATEAFLTNLVIYRFKLLHSRHLCLPQWVEETLLLQWVNIQRFA